MDQPQKEMKHIIKKGNLADVPAMPSWVDMFCRGVNTVLVTCKVIEQKKPAKVNDGKVNCRCKKCGQRLPKVEMIQVNPKNPQYLLTPECAAKRLVKKQRLAERNLK